MHLNVAKMTVNVPLVAGRTPVAQVAGNVKIFAPLTGSVMPMEIVTSRPDNTATTASARLRTYQTFA